MDANYRGARFTLVFNPQGIVTGLPGLTAAQLAVFPNPVTGKAALQVQMTNLVTTAKTVTAKLVDALGRVVRTQELPAAGATAHRLALSGVATGVYSLRIATPQGVVVKKLVVE